MVSRQQRCRVNETESGSNAVSIKDPAGVPACVGHIAERTEQGKQQKWGQLADASHMQLPPLVVVHVAAGGDLSSRKALRRPREPECAIHLISLHSVSTAAAEDGSSQGTPQTSTTCHRTAGDTKCTGPAITMEDTRQIDSCRLPWHEQSDVAVHTLNHTDAFHYLSVVTVQASDAMLLPMSFPRNREGDSHP
eukprot:GHVU01088245.1.p1 GENE.GHVU01088245.1~~GHVU01088245.1.p1  ORF type:complete len:193 (-),score=10.54 GHVU01088245.1:357-935(-)